MVLFLLLFVPVTLTVAEFSKCDPHHAGGARRLGQTLVARWFAACCAPLLPKLRALTGGLIRSRRLYCGSSVVLFSTQNPESAYLLRISHKKERITAFLVQTTRQLLRKFSQISLLLRINNIL
jgi:hypothetical protein